VSKHDNEIPQRRFHASHLSIELTPFGEAVGNLQWAHEFPVESIDQSEDALDELVFGAILRLPDGTRWFGLSAVCQPGPRAAAYLWGLFTAHGTMTHPDKEFQVLLDVDRLDIQRAWCSECRGWIDLEADAGRGDALLRNQPDYEQVLPVSAHERAELEAELIALRRTR
jgi:hypothetical protein